MSQRRVVVTGVGLVSSVGIGTQPTWDGLCAGQSGIGPISRFDSTQFASRIAGEVKGFDPLDFIDKKDVKKMDIFIQYAVAASEFALCDAGLKSAVPLGPDYGVFIASGIGGFSTIEREHRNLLEGGATEDLALLHSVGHHQPSGRSGFDQIRSQGAEFRNLYSVLGFRSRDR